MNFGLVSVGRELDYRLDNGYKGVYVVKVRLKSNLREFWYYFFGTVFGQFFDEVEKAVVGLYRKGVAHHKLVDFCVVFGRYLRKVGCPRYFFLWLGERRI